MPGLLPYLLGAAWAYRITGTIDGAVFWSGLAGVVLAVVGVEAFNEYFDSRMGTDRVFNPDDLPPMSDWVLWLGVAGFAGALAIGIYLTLLAGWPILVFAVLGGSGGGVLRGAADPLGLSRPGRDGDRAVLRPVDGARQPVSACRVCWPGARSGHRWCRAA